MPRTFNFDPIGQRTQAEQTVFGHTIGDETYGDLVGDIAGDATVNVCFNRPYHTHNKVYPITVSAESCLHSTVIRLDHGDFDYSDCTVKSKGHGIGRLILYLVAKTARDLGFVRLNAAGSKYSNLARPQDATYGYYVYPLYGFNAPIPPAVLGSLPAHLAGANTIRDLMQTANGRPYWKQNGTQLNHMEFDLTPNSPSWDMLRTLF